jgi:large subunit ribosomal protein L25
MEDLILTAKTRTKTGKGEARRLRKKGLVPAILYGGSEVVPISFLLKDLKKILSTSGGENTIFQLNIEGAKKRDRKVIAREFQNDPVKSELLHVDLYEISMDKEITVSVGITLTGKAFGVEQEGGMLNHLLKEIEIECLPTKIPDEITVDVSQLKIGDVLHLRDISIPEGIEVLDDLEEPVASVTAIVEEVVEVAAEEEGEGVEGEAKEAEEESEKPEKPEKPEKSEKQEKPGQHQKSEKDSGKKD